MLRRIGDPSAVVSEMSIVTRTCASTTWLPRWFATRNMSAFVPSYGATTVTLLHNTRAVGRANFASISPVAIATPSRPTSDSIVTSTLAATETGTMWP